METANLGCCSLTVKYLVFIFNFIFFLSGLALIVIGAIVQGFFSEYVQFFANKYETPAIGIIILGGIILIIAFFGCCGAKKENVCMLNTFAGLLGLVVICEIAACITVAALRHEIKAVVHDNMVETMDQYGSNTSLVKDAWDNLQQDYECCGVANFSNWFNSSSFHQVPDSCCKEITSGCATIITPTTTTADAEKTIYTAGCFESLQSSAMSNLAAIIGGVVALAIVEVIGIWMACGLVRAVRERYEVL